MSKYLDTKELEILLLNSIDQRYEVQANRDLGDYIFSNYLFQSLTPKLVEFSYQNRHAIADYLSDEQHLAALVDYCRHATKAYTYRRNQFINFTPAYEALLDSQYHAFFAQLRAVLQQADTIDSLIEGYSEALTVHHNRLRLILSTYCTAHLPADLPENPLLNTVPCEQYSAPFQLQLMGLAVTELAEPILDIGCGESGQLVNYLTRNGCQAFGLDRFAPVGSNFLREDWFEFDYGRGRWGTVIAHQSFSTHFIHAHLHHASKADDFARLYLKILSSLRVGGEFCYTPGLPFIESHFEKMAGYSIRKTVIEVENLLGIGEIFYAVRVKKGAHNTTD